MNKVDRKAFEKTCRIDPEILEYDNRRKTYDFIDGYKTKNDVYKSYVIMQMIGFENALKWKRNKEKQLQKETDAKICELFARYNDGSDFDRGYQNASNDCAHAIRTDNAEAGK